MSIRSFDSVNAINRHKPNRDHTYRQHITRTSAPKLIYMFAFTCYRLDLYAHMRVNVNDDYFAITALSLPSFAAFCLAPSMEPSTGGGPSGLGAAAGSSGITLP